MELTKWPAIPRLTSLNVLGGCGLPWASAEDHLRRVRRAAAMRLLAPEFLCDACWQKQVADAVQSEGK